jgi:hypothetical protein
MELGRPADGSSSVLTAAFGALKNASNFSTEMPTLKLVMPKNFHQLDKQI